MPSGASRIDVNRGEAATSPIPTQSEVIAIMAGIAEMGPIGVANDDGVTPLQSLAEFRNLYGGPTANAQDLFLAAKGFFDEAGEGNGAQLFVSRVVRCTTPGDPATRLSAKASRYLLTASFAPTKGTVTSSLVGPYDLDPGNNIGAFSGTLKVKVDGAGAVTVTFTAAAPARVSSAETFNITNTQTFTIALHGGATFTKQFLTADNEFGNYAAVTAEELAASLNQFFLANGLAVLATVTDSGTTVTLTPIKRGSGSIINVGGTASLGFTAGALAGTGNVADVHGATVAEVKTAVELAVSGCLVNNAAGAAAIETNTAGAAGSIQIDSTSTLEVLLGFDTAVHTGLAGTAENTLQWFGRWDGTYAHRLTIVVSAASNGDSSRRNVTVLKDGLPSGEGWVNVNLVPTDDNYLVKLVNEGGNGQRKSRLLTVEYVGTLAAPLNLPALGTSAALAGGNDGLAGLVDADFVGDTDGDDGATGLRVFDVLDRVDEACIPGRATATAQNGLITYCDVHREGRAFAVLGSPAGYTVAEVRAYFNSTAALAGLTETARFVYPRGLVDNPDQTIFGTDTTIVAPIEGHVMGLHARLSASKVGGAFTQASGVEDGFFRSIRGLETREAESQAKRGLLHNDRINVLRAPKGKPRFLDGADTLKRGVFKSVGESRGVVLVSNDIVIAFEDLRSKAITDALYSRLASAVRVYLRELTKAGCFRTRVEEDAFYVDFGPGLNTADVVENEEVIGRIGLNTAPPAKFMSITIVPFRGLAAALAAA
ncbi:MAG: hypothetical protein EKK55_25050 [Rhodocyclaceae bacterium]|nr:MAG: hypothetical protein EKK55_25050 [Rhodocyclaceae bacterium]